MRKQRGAAFLITLGVLTSLVSILVATAATQITGMRAISNRLEARRARLAAESGVQHALTILLNQDPNATSQQDEWYATVGQLGDTEFSVGTASFRYQIIDAASLININTAPQAQLERLPLTQEQIDSLLDWREPGLEPRPEGGKDEYYNQLTIPYNAKLLSFTTLDELLLVKGFSADVIFNGQEDLASTALQLTPKPDGSQPTIYDLCTVDSVSGNGGQQLPNISQVANVQQLVAVGIPPQVAAQIFAQRAQLTSYNALLSVPGLNEQTARTLVSSFSVGNNATLNGRINVNTASQAVLESIPNMQPDVASAIVSRQGTAVAQLGELFDVPGFTLEVARDSLDLLTTNSQRFIVRVMGMAAQVRVSLEALVSVSANGVQVLKITQLPFADMRGRWAWEDQAASQSSLVEVAQQ